MVWITSLHDLVAMVCFATCHLLMVPMRLILFFLLPFQKFASPLTFDSFITTIPVVLSLLSTDQFCKKTNATLQQEWYVQRKSHWLSKENIS